MNNNILIPITPNLLPSSETAIGKEVTLINGDKLERIDFDKLATEVGAEANDFEMLEINLQTAAPIKKGFYFPTEAGIYANYGNIEVTTEQLEQLVLIVLFDGVTFSLIEKSIPALGVVEEGNAQAVSGGEVYDSFKIELENKLTSDYIVKDVSIASNGNIAPNRIGATSIINFPLKKGIDYYVGGFIGNSSKYTAITDLNGVVLEVKGTLPIPLFIPKDINDRLLRMNVGFTNETNIDVKKIFINENKLIGTGYIYGINGTPLKAKALEEGNSVPNPINGENAVNKSFFDANALKDSDLNIKVSTNLFDRSKIVDDKYISNTGSVQSVDGWQFILINVSKISDLSNITFGRIKPSTPSYWCFYNTDVIADLNVDNKITNGSFVTTENSTTVEKPVGAITLGITIKRPANTDTVYQQGTINIGSELLPYEAYYQVIDKIKDYDLQGGGESYNQDLNTFDDVSFAKVTASIETSLLITHLPIGISSVTSGRWYLEDMGDYYEPRIKK